MGRWAKQILIEEFSKVLVVRDVLYDGIVEMVLGVGHMLLWICPRGKRRQGRD